MLNIILNEKKIVEDFLQRKQDNHIKLSDIIKLLIKYYYIEHRNEDDIKEKMYHKILDDLKKFFGAEFVYTKWSKTVKYMIGVFFKNVSKYNLRVELYEIQEISVSKSELDRIQELQDKKLEKVAFILLIYGKIANIKMDSGEGWIKQSISDIFKEAKVVANDMNKKIMLNELYKRKYIDISNRNTRINIKVDFIDNEGEELIIKDFDGSVHRYLIYLGENWKRCEICNKWIKVKGRNCKYCKVCKKEMDKKKYLKYNGKRQ